MGLGENGPGTASVGKNDCCSKRLRERIVRSGRCPVKWFYLDLLALRHANTRINGSAEQGLKPVSQIGLERYG